MSEGQKTPVLKFAAKKPNNAFRGIVIDSDSENEDYIPQESKFEMPR